MRERLGEIRKKVAKRSPKKASPKKPASPPRSPVPLRVQSAWMSMVGTAPPRKVRTLHDVSTYLLSKRKTRMRMAESAMLPITHEGTRAGHVLFTIRQDQRGAFQINAFVLLKDRTEIPFEKTIKLKDDVQAATLTQGLAQLLATKNMTP